MSEFRYMTLCAEDLEDLERAGKSLLRHHETTFGIRLLGIVLRLREQSGFCAADQVFMCDVDESAGMADVVEIHSHSWKTPCS